MEDQIIYAEKCPIKFEGRPCCCEDDPEWIQRFLDRIAEVMPEVYDDYSD